MVLFLNDIGTSEVLLILFFILIFFGAKSIPGLARTMGRTIRQVKDASAEIQNEIKKSGADMKKDLNLNGLLQETAEDIKRPLDQYADDLDQAIKYQPTRKNAIIDDKPEPVDNSIIVTDPPSQDITNEKVVDELVGSPQFVDESKDPEQLS